MIIINTDSKHVWKTVRY